MSSPASTPRRQHRRQRHADSEGGGSHCHPVRQRALGVVARRRDGEANRPPDQHDHGRWRRRSTGIGIAHPDRTDAGGELARKSGDTRLRRYGHRALIGTVLIAGDGTFGDLAVMTNDGGSLRHVRRGHERQGRRGGRACETREVVDTWAYPGTGRPHGIWYRGRASLIVGAQVRAGRSTRDSNGCPRPQ